MNSIQDLLDRYRNDYIVDIGYTDDTKPSTFQSYQKWVEQQHHLPLSYLDGERKIKRENLNNYWDGCQSSLVFLFSYKNIQSHLSKIYSTHPKWNG